MYFNEKKILVIGGTGTIGKSIVQSIMKENPKFIKIFSRDEFKQHQLQHELGNSERLRFVIGDIRDYDSLYAAMHDIDYVLHLAAMKHVDLCEYNPYEAIKTNIHGTNNVIKAAISQNVKKAVFTSSDKAISPTNTYGATKLIAERLISSTEYNKTERQTVFASVRFGNVMGSRGSVIPLFKDRILKDKKITVTDKNMTRFMMSLNQATQLTIKALKEAKGGEVFVLKMPVIKLGDLADILIEQTCKKYKLNSNEIKVEVIGLRPGEKMFEELMTYDESRLAWELKDMYIIPGTKEVSYTNSTKCNHGTYSSMNQAPLNVNELRNLLREEKLI
ncbi:SDR family NAD(P)-dependent oxidoreductase [Oceanobacillus damuensis]|uniref:SDR family NAD(P)-dependent oxidoreductase n=1 Tax=Oceanobacillus damuensis TaxID=937928 RepID=UPI000835C519|nr:SDR family NAD(P)-dependent oxidoreductase [Oceanobacillus damuensis]